MVERKPSHTAWRPEARFGRSTGGSGCRVAHLAVNLDRDVSVVSRSCVGAGALDGLDRSLR